MHLFQQGSREPGVYNASGDKLGSIDDLVIDKLSAKCAMRRSNSVAF